MQVHLLDGTYELFRAHFGAPSRRAPDGREVGATVGLLRSFAALLRDPEVTHVASAFDTVVESFRNRLFDGYKTGEGIDPELHAQFPLAERACKALGIATWSMIEFEADDALATAAFRLRNAPEVSRILLCSPDKDLAQCVEGDRIVGFDRKKRALLDERGVHEKFGVGPASIPDYLALVGDAADGIPGVPKWGKKAAATLLARYRHWEEIPSDPDSWDVSVRGRAGLAASLASHREEVALYRRLATLRTDAPLEPGGDDAASLLDALTWRGPDRDALASLTEELGIGSLDVG